MAKLARGTLALFSALELLQVRNKEGIIKKKKKSNGAFKSVLLILMSLTKMTLKTRRSLLTVFLLD